MWHRLYFCRNLNQNTNVSPNFIKTPNIELTEIRLADLELLQEYRQTDGAISIGAPQGRERAWKWHENIYPLPWQYKSFCSYTANSSKPCIWDKWTGKANLRIGHRLDGRGSFLDAGEIILSSSWSPDWLWGPTQSRKQRASTATSVEEQLYSEADNCLLELYLHTPSWYGA